MKPLSWAEYLFHIGGTREKKQGMGGRIDVTKQRICQEFQNINTLGASPTSNQQHYTVCLKYNENSPKMLKAFFVSKTVYARQSFLDENSVMFHAVWFQDTSSVQVREWPDLSFLAWELSCCSAASPLLFHGQEHSFIGLKVKTRCMALFSLGKYLLQQCVAGSQHASFSSKQGRKRFLLV